MSKYGESSDNSEEGQAEIVIGNTETVVNPINAMPEWVNTDMSDLDEDQKLILAVRKSVMLQAHEHAASDVNEVGGALFGQAYQFDDYLAVEIVATVPANAKDSGPTHIRFSADVWAEMMKELREGFPDLIPVGWYHSHPRMGVYLSPNDQDIHKVVFHREWQIAYVVNGQNQTGGFFGWQDDQITPIEDFIVINDCAEDSANICTSFASYQLVDGEI